jgi:hypothetical protein
MAGADQRGEPDQLCAIGKRHPGLPAGVEPLADPAVPRPGRTRPSLGLGAAGRRRSRSRHRDTGRIGLQPGPAGSRHDRVSSAGRERFPAPRDGLPARRTGCQSPGDQHERLDQPRDQPAGADRDGFRGRPLLRRPSAVPGTVVAAAQSVRQRQPRRGRCVRRPAFGLYAVGRQAVHGFRVQLLGAGPLPRRRRDSDGRDGRHSRLGRHLAVRVQPQPRQSVPAGPAGLFQHGHRSAQPSGRARQPLPVPARRHASGAAQREHRDDPGRFQPAAGADSLVGTKLALGGVAHASRHARGR